MKIYQIYTLVLAATVAAFIAVQPTPASMHGSAPVVVSCPFTTFKSGSINDGCTTAVVAGGLNTGTLSSNLSYQNPNLLAPVGTPGTIFQNDQQLPAHFHDPADQVD